MLFVLLNGVVRAEGEKISDIVIKGNRRIETSAILNVVKLKAGDLLFADKVDADVRSIYILGHFQDVKAETATGDKGVALTYTVLEKPIVREITYEGNKKLAVDKLQEAVELKTSAIFSSRDLTRSVKKIKKLYADEGYYLAEVEGVTEKRSETELKVIFKIAEGKKVLIQTIRFDGNRVFSRRKLLKMMETKEGWFLSWLTGAGAYKEEVLRNDVNRIADFYYNNGYVAVKVGEPKVELLPDKSGLVVTVGVTEGDQFRVGALDFKGDLLEGRNDLAGKLKMKTGEIFNRSLLRVDILTLTDLYADKGYAFANVTPLTNVNTERKIVDINFDVEKGEKVYIDRINIGGNIKTRDKVIRRELKLAEGDLYSSTGLKRSKQSLMNLGFFEEANLATAKGSADNRLNLNVDVKERPTGTFSVGAGYSSLDGLIAQGSVQQANFLGLGLKGNASASIGGKSQTYSIGLTDPYFMDTKWTLGGDIYRSDREYLDFTRRVTGGDIKAGYPLSDTISTYWIYRFEEKRIFNFSPTLLDNIARDLILQPETSATTSAISASLTRDTVDFRRDPSKGMVNSISLEYAGLGGTSRYVRYIGNTSVFFPAIWGTVVALRGELGHIQGMGKEVPIDEKFYLGGINTIRGYDGRTVSPYRTFDLPATDISGIASRSDTKVYLGGDTEALFNVEYQFPILKGAGLKGLLFMDAGNSCNGIDKIFSRFQASYGFGFRWFSPMGPLRLEYGIPINPRTGIDNSGGRLEFSIGSFF
ncbi:MAG: outer membrane protein assembly factor BamA [Geobacteraceae bacterium]